MARSTVHYADNETNNILKRLHNKLRPAGTPVQRVEYIIELLLLRIFEVKLKRDPVFEPLRKLFTVENEEKLFYYLTNLTGDQALKKLNESFFPFYSKILSNARTVFKENPPQKVLDQLVLIEEVFDNSSFTANVKGGMLHEILGLVEELDEERLLHTDLLGDAIESALSETGGTRDIGLYRTPDHIRQLMVAMVDPHFSDVIFDPACGTGGFLFDSFQYVIEKVTKDGKWPGPRAHPDVQNYFKNKFSQFNEKMPTADTANAFYRNGVSGIEYLGMIRKMAAVNLFIRGLNPHNIEQGDSLKMFNPASDAGSKSIVIANPPFGAERDQSAYPNVWEEYSKESETTILFVKLMFDLLKKGGRCAVIVSEGFLTWDQSSAKALRKMLLDEANLKAIISLPQGVFVSKGGQGAKTSILYFEKGEPTKHVWFYKIENDGYTMGVNRKPASGSQIPEIIDLFTKHVRKGISPPETKNSFAIPAEWIKTLDPRIKERLRRDTREVLTVPGKREAECFRN
jgi:type I restriction-modification system DNA methylase subunit